MERKIKKVFLDFDKQLRYGEQLVHFEKMQNAKLRGESVNETDNDIRFKEYLKQMLSADSKTNPIGFC